MEYSRLRISLLLLLSIILFGTFSYSLIEKMSLFDSFYMTLITISTVGFSEITPLTQSGRFITIIIIVSGISLLTYTLSQIAQIFIEGELRKTIGGEESWKNRLQICTTTTSSAASAESGRLSVRNLRTATLIL